MMVQELKPVFKQGDEINKHGTNSKPRTMGVASSREVLLSSREPRESKRNSNWYLRFIPENHRLVRDELREEVQCSIHDQQTIVRDCVPILQESSKSLQQEDVRPILPVQTNQVQGSGHNSGPAKLFRVGSLG
jgi:hypothetical protein